MIHLSSEQEERRDILYDMYKVISQNNPLECQRIREGGVIWLHLVDRTLMGFDLERLIEIGILTETNHSKTNMKSWEKYFKPTGYLLTEKGKKIYGDPARWVFKGEWE